MESRHEISQIYSLTPVQEGILAQCIWNQTSSNYFLQKVYNINGEVDLNALQKSVDIVVDRNEILRTIFVYRRVSKPQQVVLNHRTAKIMYMDLSELEDSEVVMAAIEQYKQEDKEKGFDLSRNVMIRFAVLKLAPERYKIVLSFHHIIMDGWSLNIVFKQLFEIYSKLLIGANLDLGEPQTLNGYFRWLERQSPEASIGYWKNYLRAAEHEPLLQQQDGLDIYRQRHDEFEFLLDQAGTRQLSLFAARHGLTVSNILLAIWALFLQKQTGRKDVVFGRLVSGRKPSIENIENTVGLFINILPLRVTISQSDSILSVTQRIQRDILESDAYDYLPLHRIMAEANASRLFDHLFIYENYPMDYKELAVSSVPDLNLSITLEQSEEKVVYPLYIYVVPNEQMAFRIKYFPHEGSNAFMQAIQSFYTNAVRQLERGSLPHEVLMI